MEEKNILHELYVFSEWKPEPEYLQKPDNILPENLAALWKWFKFFGPKKSLIDSVTAHKEKQSKWHIALGDEGKVIAILTDNILEIRTKRSEYATIAARTTVSRDGYSQWRKLVWSPDCSLLALAYGNGLISFFDLTASNIYNIPADCTKPAGMECTDNTHAIADIIFMPLRVKDNKWSWEVVVVGAEGAVRTLAASQAEVALQHRSRLPPAAAANYSTHHRLLLLATLPSRHHKDPSTALGAGLTAWRILNDDPFYKLSAVSDRLEDDRFQMYVPFWSSKNTAFIVDMALSPDQSKVVCIHCNGEVSVWSLPLLKLIYRYPLVTQPQHDLRNPLIKDEIIGKKDVSIFYPADVNWWSNEELVLSRFSGVVSVCHIKDLVNILGKKPEFFQGAPRITCAHHGTFMVLECETNILPAKKSRSDESMEVVKPEEDSEDSILDVTKELVKSVLYAITDMETFQPRPRRVSVVTRVYRLLGVKSTTPQDLFSRKIESGNYSEALVLADSYNLDSDLVYQQQWRKNPVSTNAIHNYLSKVSKKIWAVHQCVDRLPETLPAAKELLQFGLKLTNEKILEDINQEREDLITDPEDITLEDLNAYTSELLRCRHVMLFYKERLSLYEAILKCEKSTYVKDEYDRLRSNSIVHSSIETAKEGRIEALTCLWPHIKTTATQLAVLEKLPETKNPLDYQHLLPTKQPIQPFEKMSPIKVPPSKYEKDWCRKETFRSIWNSNWSEDSTPDSDNSLSYTDDVAKWYDKRAREIEERSGLVSHALTLVTLATVGGAVEGLDNMMFHLLTLDTLIYDINVEGVKLSQLEKMSVLDTCGMLMKMSTPATFVSDIKQFVVPFLKRYEKLVNRPDAYMSGFMDYLESLSVNDLSYILLIVQSPREFELDVRTHLELAERCLFAYQGTDQLDMACDLLDTMLQESDGSIPSAEVVRRVSRCERAVRGAARSSRRRPAPPAALRDAAAHPAAARALLAAITPAHRYIHRTTHYSTQSPPPRAPRRPARRRRTPRRRPRAARRHHARAQIYARALLTCGDAASIKLASSVLTCSTTGRRGHLVPHNKSIELVSTAAKQYFNSASSLSDPALELARCCLQLVKDDNPEIKLEIDLISALKLLSSFGVNLLPVQVRLCADKMSLIEECMDSDPNAFLASHKLLKLAALLRICGNDERAREIAVTRSVCARALAAGAGGGAAAAAAARRLAELRAGGGAAALLAAGATSPHCAPHAAAARPLLLAAAAAAAATPHIAAVLAHRLQIELEDLEEVNAALKEHTKLHERAPSTDDEYCDAVTTPVIERKDLVAPAKSEQTPLFNYLMNTFQNKFAPGESQPSGAVRSLRVPEFYRSVYPECDVHDSQFGYDRFSLPEHAQHSHHSHHSLPYKLLKCYYVQNCLEPCADEHVEMEVVQKCAEEFLYKDTAFSVACLLRSTQDSSQCEKLMNKQATDTAVSSVLYATLLKCNAPELKDNAYLTPPAEMALTTLRQNNASEEQMDLVRRCIDKLAGMGEVDTLRNLGFAVNGLLFNADEDYRNEIINRVARSPDKEHVEAAFSLASKYNIDTLDVWLQHASAAIHERRPILVPPPNVPTAHERITEALWNQIQGSDHNGLMAYFIALRSVDERPQMFGLTADKHVKLLKKAKAASTELDYKLVVSASGATELSSHITEIARPDNIGMIAKFLRTLPPTLKLPITVNAIYTVWLTKYFFSVGAASGTNKKWMQQYRACASYFNKLGKQELKVFVANTCFSTEAVQRIRAATRVLMVTQAVEYCDQEHDQAHTNTNEVSWLEVGRELSQWAQFLEKLHSPPIRTIAEENKLVDTALWIELEKTHGETESIIEALSRLVIEAQLKYRTMTIIIDNLCENVDVSAVFKNALTICKKHSSLVPTLIDQVIQYHKEGTKFSDDVIQNILDLAASTNAPPHKQIALLSLSDRVGVKESGDMMKVANFCVDLFTTEWPELPYIKEITADMLTTEEGRVEAFQKLLPECDTWQRKKALVDVLNCWPTTKLRSGRSVQCEFLGSLLCVGRRQESLILIKLLLPGTPLTSEEIKWLSEKAEGDAVVNVVWIMLLANCEQYKDDIVKLTMTNKDTLQELEIEDELVKELLDNAMFIKLVPTPLYASVINYIMNKEAAGGEPTITYTVKWATDQLVQNNCLAEAGHLHLTSIGVPTALHGFTQAVLYSKRYFFKK